MAKEARTLLIRGAAVVWTGSRVLHDADVLCGGAEVLEVGRELTPPLGVTVLGAINSRFFNRTLARTDFANESVRDWFSFGVSATIAPTVVVIFVLLGLGLSSPRGDRRPNGTVAVAPTSSGRGRRGCAPRGGQLPRPSGPRCARRPGARVTGKLLYPLGMCEPGNSARQP